MKKLSLVSVLLSVAFLAGAIVGSMFGFNPMISGAIVATGSLFASVPAGAFATGIDVSDIVTDLGAYMSVPKTMQELWSRLFTGLELAPYTKKISGVTGSYAGVQSTMSEVLQPWQSAFTKKGVATMTPYLNQVYRMKVDYVIENIDDVVGSWLMFLHDETKERKDWPLVKYILEMELLPKVIEEMNSAMCVGEYAAPTPGTAGAAADSMNGLLTIIANEITATNLTAITTGAIASTDAVSKIETFADGIDTKWTDKGGIIFCSKTVERYYKKDYRDTFGLTNDKDAKNNTKLDHYNINLVGLEGFGSSQRLVYVAPNNLLHLYDKIFQPSQFQVQQDKRDVVLFSDWHTGVGFNSLDAVYVNDQA